MYKIKQVPEDFIVREIITPQIVKADGFLLFWMTKKDYTTLGAAEQISKALKIPLKNIGFAGNKDKNAVTEQLISIKGAGREKVEKLKLKDINLEYKGVGEKPVSLGDLEGNSFEITVRNITAKDYKKLIDNRRYIPNIFGEQRFSKNNAEVGRLMVKRQFDKAVKIILEGEGEQEKQVREFLKKGKNNHVGALRQIPKKTLMLYIHSYQSKLWNETVKELLKKQKGSNMKVPMIGFGMEVKNKEVKDIIDRIMAREKLKDRDFIIREIPELSAEGGERDLYMEAMNLDISRLEEDELNKGKKKAVLRFNLQKGSYATVVIKYLFS